jgi:hypothetical protein
MLRALGTGLAGLGVTIASTFAGSLGLSLHQQRIMFVVGVAVMLLGGFLLWRDRRSARHRAAEPSDGQRQTGRPDQATPPEHRQLLRDLLHGAVGAIEQNRQFGFDEESSVGPPVHRNSFAAHFPHLAERVEAWNESLFARERPRSELGHRILQEAQQRGLLDPPYWKDNVLLLLRDTTLARIENGLPSQQLPLVRWERSAHSYFGWTLQANDKRIATGEESVLDEAQRRVSELLAETQSWPEAAAVGEADRRYMLSNEKQPLLADLRKRREAETIFAADGCEICRLNRGEQGSTTFSVRVA